jgi:replication factor C small subunit
MSFLEEEVDEAPANAGHTLWIEKYRPAKLSDYVGNEQLKAKVAKFIETNDIPHLLFYGKAGTGKTTLAKLIAKSIKADVLYMNASDERRIDDIRDKIRGFASTLGFNPLKIVILDEADYLPALSQGALRNLMETFSQTTRFILTCNYHERITEPIVSRCQVYEIIPPTKKDVALRLMYILGQENVTFDKNDIVLIVNSHYPDIRSCIGLASQSSIDGKLTLSQADVIEGDLKAKIVDEFKNPNRKDAYKNIRQMLADNSIRNYADFYTVLYERLDEYAPNHAATVITTLADHQAMDANVMDKEINFMAAVVKILREIK